MYKGSVTTISPALFIKSIWSQLRVGTGDIVLTPKGASTCYPFGSSVRPIIKREDAELICKLAPVVDFHANAFGYHMPGFQYIINRQFFEFCFYLESKDYIYDPKTIPEEYTRGSELIHEAFKRLNSVCDKHELTPKQRHGLTIVLISIIKDTLDEKLTEPCIPHEPLWRPYANYDLDVLVGHYYISRKAKGEDKWIYTNHLTWVQFEGGEINQHRLAMLITEDTGERLGYREIDDYGDDFKPVHEPILGPFNPWQNKK